MKKLTSNFGLSALIVSAITALTTSTTSAGESTMGPTHVGNGDDGSDLESAAPLIQGPIVQAREAAVKTLKRLDIDTIYGLGTLIPEVENSKLFLSKQDIAAQQKEDLAVFHSDMRGLVFARTFPQSHAETRFFPIAEKLTEQQLIALHIHEALHRSLPEHLREDESIVTNITLAITSPASNHDRIRATMAKHIPAPKVVPAQLTATSSHPDEAGYRVSGNQSVTQVEDPIPENAAVKQPSLVGYSYRNYSAPKGVALYPIKSMHVLQSFLYPFGNDRVPLGFGIEASMINLESETLTGPLSLSARMRLWSKRGFDIGAWGVASLNTLSAEELKRSPIGRDVSTVGLSMTKDINFFYVENLLSITFGSKSKSKLSNYEYTYHYGNVINADIHAGARIKKLKIGGFVGFGLADYFKVDGPDFAYDTGRYRLVTVGPEVVWREKDFSVSLTGRFMANSSKEVNFDQLGNIMGQGVGQGSVSGAFHVYF